MNSASTEMAQEAFSLNEIVEYEAGTLPPPPLAHATSLGAAEQAPAGVRPSTWPGGTTGEPVPLPFRRPCNA